MKHIVYMSWVSMSELDVALPIIWKLRQVYPDARITVIFGKLNYKSILRENQFHLQMLKKLNCEVQDYSDYLKSKYRLFRGLIRYISAKHPKDILPIGEKLLFWIEKKLYGQVVTDDLIKYLATSDLLLLAAQPMELLDGHKEIRKFMERQSTKVFQIPHALIQRSIKDVFKDNKLPFYIDTLVFTKSLDGVDVSKTDNSQIKFVRFPGFEIEWHNWLFSNSKIIETSFNRRFRLNLKNKSMIVVLIRKIVNPYDHSKFVKRAKPESLDDGPNFTPQTYVEVIKQILETFKDKQEFDKPTIVVKQHPRGDIRLLKKIHKDFDLGCYIFDDSIYALIPFVDLSLVVGGTITAYLAASQSKFVTILLPQNIEQDKQYLVRKLCMGFGGTISDIGELYTIINKISQDSAWLIDKNNKHLAEMFVMDDKFDLVNILVK